MYLAAPLAVLHQVLLTKVDWLSPLAHGAALAVLLGWRVRRARLDRLQSADSPAV